MASINKLTLAEELLLITLDDESGMLLDSISPFKNHIAIAASLIMELTLKGNIDLDAKKLFVVSSVETGDPILDLALAEIVAEETPLVTSEWLKRFAKRGEDLSNQIIDSLVAKGIMQLVDRRLFWVLKTRSYSASSGIEEREVRARIMLLLNNDEIPDPNDALLVGLLKAVGIFNLLISPSELARLQNRIDEIANLEEINRSLYASIQEAWDFMIRQVKSYHNY
jgi:golgi phosphoprotein 3